MTAMTIDETAGALVRRLEDRERLRSRVPLPVARQAVARRVGVPAGTLENLRRGRIKGVREWVATALRQAVIAELEADIARHEHELTILKASPGRLAREQVEEVSAGLAALRGVLRGE